MLRWLKRLALLTLLLVVVFALAAWWLLRGSLPQLNGEVALAGLSAPVAIERDALGTVTINAANETDAMHALGYVHAQERFFEMDLLRRTAAGELAALFGPIAISVDRQYRVHRMRARVERDLDAIAGTKQPQLQAYSDGVNAGLAALRVRPWPYLLLRQPPEPWRKVDTALVAYAMYFDLQGGHNARELALWKMRPHLPPALFALLTRDGTQWDAPLLGEPRGDAILPDSSQVDLRRLPQPDRLESGLAETVSVAALTSPLAPRAAGHFPGSNNFAVSGALTSDGRAIVADDMHLTLRAPNIWFRARLRYADARAPHGAVDVQGFTLPGLPAVVVGSNGHVAWAFTNSYGDYQDWKVETPCTSRATRACAAIVRRRETIVVAGSDPVPFEVEETTWGPIVHRMDDANALSLRWTAHLPGSVNLGITDFPVAASIEEALAIADRTAIPTQNLVLGDAGGRIAWRLLGPLPQRGGGCDPLAPIHAGASTSVVSCPPWPASTAASPRLESPTADRLWTANHRTLDGEPLRRIGDGGYALGARARQIRDGLFAKRRFSERDLLAIQLDDRASFLQPWRKLLAQQSASARTPALVALSGAASDWNGRAGIDSVGYRIVRAWRLAVHARIVDGLTAPAQAALGKDFTAPDLPQLEGVAWPLVTQRPQHLLSRRYESWDALFEDAAREVRVGLEKQGPLEQRTWGERNTAAICHPLAKAIPLIGKRLLCMPPDPLPGDSAMPRVQGPNFGASERMVVSPGHEQDGIIHMPGGQSGHFLSPFWGAGHDDWVHGRPTPFLPGKTAHRLTLSPPALR